MQGTPTRTSLPATFWGQVDTNGPEGRHSQTKARLGPCWLWTGGRSKGYGHFSLPKQQTKGAHRLAYEDQVGPIAPGLHLDHLCDHRGCCRPSHLEPVTAIENARRRCGRGILGVMGSIRRRTLRDVRKLAQRTQAAVAEAMDIRQGDVSILEKRADLENVRLGTLRRFIEALGGRLELVAVVDKERFILVPFADDDDDG